jgi:Tfp pilus assembly protein PilW
MVEVLIAMAVTSLVLLGLTSVVFVGNNAYRAWAAPIQAAESGPPLAILASNIQSDTHRLVPCQPGQQPGSVLNLCHPMIATCPVVRYRGAGGQVVRETSPLSPCSSSWSQTAIMLRDLSSAPTFAVTGCSTSATSTAVITVSGITYASVPGQQLLNVFIAAPVAQASGWNC